MKILAVESTCDDTSIALINDGIIIFDIKLNSEAEHSIYGGIIPEIAARKHQENIIIIFQEIMKNYNSQVYDIDYIAYASEPGLAGSLHVGKIFAETIAWFYKIEIIKVNHIHAHCFSAFIDQSQIQYPFLSLVASGGTTSLFLIRSTDDVLILNKKKDDAIGEAFDKVGRILNLEYPGGPEIDKIFDLELVENIFKKQAIEDDFSFSGAKSKIKNIVDKYKKNNQEVPIRMLASSFQFWAINLLLEKISFYNIKYKPKIITIGGGVSANFFWRQEIKKMNLKILSPKKQYCTDNAAMIAFLASEIVKGK